MVDKLLWSRGVISDSTSVGEISTERKIKGATSRERKTEKKCSRRISKKLPFL